MLLNKNEISGYISIKMSGKVENSSQPEMMTTNVFDVEEISKVKHSELIEKILLDKIVDSLKYLKKIMDGENNGNHKKA